MCNYDEGIGRCGVLPPWVHSNLCTSPGGDLARKSVLAHYNCGARPNLCRREAGVYPRLEQQSYNAALRGMRAERQAQLGIALAKRRGKGRGRARGAPMEMALGEIHGAPAPVADRAMVALLSMEYEIAQFARAGRGE